MELPGGGAEWLAPSPSPSGPVVPGRHDQHGVGTFIWPPVGTSTWPPMGTFSWPRTPFGDDRHRYTTQMQRRAARVPGVMQPDRTHARRLRQPVPLIGYL